MSKTELSQAPPSDLLGEHMPDLILLLQIREMAFDLASASSFKHLSASAIYKMILEICNKFGIDSRNWKHHEGSPPIGVPITVPAAS